MTETRPRHPLLVILWSLGLFVLVHTTQYVAIGLSMAATGASFGAVASGQVRTPETLAIRGAVAIVLGVPATFLVVRLLWRRSAAWLGLSLRPRLLALGAALGLVLATQVVWVMVALGIAQVSVSGLWHSPATLVPAVLGALAWSGFVAVLEEVVFRGMVTRELAARWGWPAGTLAGGGLFAAAHLAGLAPRLTLLEGLWIATASMTAGALFVALYVRRGSLWLPIGFHWGWNLALSAVFGATMSGNRTSLALLETSLSGPASLTGGGFGLEASVVTMVVLGLAAPLAAMVRSDLGAAAPARRPIARREPGAESWSATAELSPDTGEPEPGRRAPL